MSSEGNTFGTVCHDPGELRSLFNLATVNAGEAATRNAINGATWNAEPAKGSDVPIATARTSVITDSNAAGTVIGDDGVYFRTRPARVSRGDPQLRTLDYGESQ